MNTVRHVRQRGSRDCAVACLSMLTGRPYEEMLVAVTEVRPDGAEKNGGLDFIAFDALLALYGYAVARRWPRWPQFRDWTPAPWAPVPHHVEVIKSGGAHAVVVLPDGSVLDPAREGRGRLGDYPEVTTIAAVTPYDALDSAREDPGMLWRYGEAVRIGEYREEREGER